MITQEILKTKLESIPGHKAYDTRYNYSEVKWFKLKKYTNDTFTVQLRWRYKHWEDIGFTMVKTSDYASNFDITFRYEYVDGHLKLHLTNVSDSYNEDGTGIDILEGLIKKSISVGAAISGNVYLVWAGTIFDFAMKSASFKKGDVIGTAANAIYNSLK